MFYLVTLYSIMSLVIQECFKKVFPLPSMPDKDALKHIDFFFNKFQNLNVTHSALVFADKCLSKTTFILFFFLSWISYIQQDYTYFWVTSFKVCQIIETLCICPVPKSFFFLHTIFYILYEARISELHAIMNWNLK